MIRLVHWLFQCSILLFTLASLPLPACTLWAATGTLVQGGGTLVGKNDDTQLNHTMQWRLVVPKTGFRYLELYKVDGDKAGTFNGGMNERGLVIVNAATTVPDDARAHAISTPNLMIKILTSCDSVDSALAKQSIFHGLQGFIIADSTKCALVEMAPEGKTAIYPIKNDCCARTNHYALPELQWANYGKTNNDSVKRLHRIVNLLVQSVEQKQPLTFEKFLTFSRDVVANTTANIFKVRTSPTDVQTRATIVVRQLPDTSPMIYLWILNPGKPAQEITVTMDDILSGKVKLPLQ